MWWEVITEALIDTVKLFPFLFLLYILIELMEHNTRLGKSGGALSGKLAPLVGATAGLLPMCGFSVMAAKLWERRHVTIGTLLAVFIATSDEALLVLILSDLDWKSKLFSVLATCGIKVLLGAGIGYLADLITKRRSGAPALLPMPEEVIAHDHVRDCAEENADLLDHVHEEHDHAHGEEFSVCEHKHGKRSTLSLYFFSPLLHALKIAAFVLIFNLAFGYLFFGIGGGNAEAGQEKVVGFLQGAGYWYQPLVCCLIGFIPNCASSVALAETFALGGIAFGSFFAGLIANAGLGYLVFLRSGKKQGKSILVIFAVMLAVSLAVGYAVNLVALCL